MPSHYIPPHLRGQQQTTSSTAPPKRRNPSDGYTAIEIANQFNLSSKPGTLNASDDEPGKLAFVLIFKDQHPDWKTEGKLLCKTNLHLFSSAPAPNAQTQSKDTAAPAGTVNGADAINNPNDNPAPSSAASSTPPTQLKEPSTELPNPSLQSPSAKETSTSPPNPSLPTHLIPIFTQLPTPSPPEPRPRKHTFQPHPHPEQPLFTFTGYYLPSSLLLLQPRSPALISLLDRKFTPLGKKRSPESWDASLGMEWGVVGFERAGGEEEEEGGLGNPMVVLKREMGGGGTEWMGGEGKGKGNEGIIGGIED